MGPWVVSDKLPSLVVHVGEAIVEVGAEVGVDVVDVELTYVTDGVWRCWFWKAKCFK